MKKTVIWNVYEEEIAYMKAELEKLAPQISRIRSAREKKKELEGQKENWLKECKERKHRPDLETSNKFYYAIKELEDILTYSAGIKEKYYVNLQKELVFSLTSLSRILQAEKLMRTLQQDANMFATIETVIDNFVKENISRLSYPTFFTKRHSSNIITFEEAICIKAEVSPSGMSGITDRHLVSDDKTSKYKNFSIKEGHYNPFDSGRKFLLEKLSLLIKFLEELTHVDSKNLCLICHQLVLDSVVKQFAESWIFKYPQFHNLGKKEDALESYVSLGYRVESETFFPFVCWLYYDLDIPTNFFDFLISIQTDIPEFEKNREYMDFKKKMLPENSIKTNTQKAVTIGIVDGYSGIEFERFIGTLFEADGYRVEYTLVSNDKGIDIIARRSGISIGIQCKCYSSTVGVSAIQEVFAGKSFYSLDKALVVTNNYFTAAAKELAKSTGVILWDRDILISKISLL